MKARYNPEAAEEAVEIARYLERRGETLGDRFLDAVRSCVDEIEKNPRLYPKDTSAGTGGEIRSRSVERFHYSVIYEVLGDELVILAIKHHKRRAGYWRHRRG